MAYSIGDAFIEVDDDPILRWQFPIELRTLEISVLDRLTEDPRANAKAAAEVVIVAPSTMATGSFIVVVLEGNVDVEQCRAIIF